MTRSHTAPIKTLWAIGALLVPLFWPGGASAIQAVPSDDSFIEQGSSGTNGSATRLRVGDGGK